MNPFYFNQNLPTIIEEMTSLLNVFVSKLKEQETRIDGLERLLSDLDYYKIRELEQTIQSLERRIGTVEYRSDRDTYGL